jgi:PKD repeat protein
VFIERRLSQQHPNIQTVKNIKDTRLSQKARLAFLVALLALLTLSSPKPIFASTGNIHINSTVPSGTIIEVQIGGNISLYFGLVNWSGGQVNLYLSRDGYAFLSSQNDVRFGPTFSVAKIRDNATDSSTYPNYVVGKNWINGTIPKTAEVAGGDYFVKAFDGSSTAVAVSTIYFTITASFEVAPEYGPGHAPMELRGYSLPPNDYVNISYYDGHSWKTIENFYRAGANGRLSYVMPAPDLAEVLPAGVNPDSISTITFRLAVNSTGQTFNGTFNEYRRGLRQIYSPDSQNLTVSEGHLFGNNTVFVLYGLYVRVKGDLTVAGRWFSPGTITILWDDTTLMGVATADGNGTFKTTVTVPITSEGNHSIFIRDSTVKFILKVQCFSVLDLVPPVVDAGPDLTVNEDATFSFDGSGSTDNKGIVSYEWTFIDTLPKTLHGVNPEYVFLNPGVYHVTLNVTDVGGNWVTDDLVVTVLDITKPVAEAGPDHIVNEDMWVTFNGTGSTDNKGISLYVWTIVGNTNWTLTGAIVEHFFIKPGVFTVTLNVSDAAGNWGTDELTVTVMDVTNPFAEAGVNQTIVEGGTVNFNACYSSDNIGIAAYEWDFGDGTYGSGMIVNHTYEYPWNYTIYLTVIDHAGNNDTDFTAITVLRDTDRDSIPNMLDSDDDGDGIPDVWEEKYGLNPLNSTDASMDNDGDGLINLREFLGNTNPNDFFSPLKLWVIAVTLIPVIVVAIAAYFMARTAKVSKQEYVEKEIAKFIKQFPDVKQLNPSYFNWKVAEIRQEAEKQYDELTKTGYIVATRTPIRERLNKALKKKPEKPSQ